jgi:hypothetical protein
MSEPFAAINMIPRRKAVQRQCQQQKPNKT